MPVACCRRAAQLVSLRVKADWFIEDFSGSSAEKIESKSKRLSHISPPLQTPASQRSPLFHGRSVWFQIRPFDAAEIQQEHTH